MKRGVYGRAIKMAVVGVLCGVCNGALAQHWPERPVTLVVPYAPGGNIDQAARVIGRELSEKLGQQFIVESKGGAGGKAIWATIIKSANIKLR